jgi:hypothetical protein
MDKATMNEIELDIESVPENLTAMGNRLDSIPLPELIEITIDYFDNRTRKHVQLIGNKDPEKALTSKRDWIGYELKEISFISFVAVRCVGFSENDEFELSFKDSFSKQVKSVYAKPINGAFVLKVDRFIEGFGIRPPFKFFKAGEIAGIDVFGISNEELGDLTRNFVPVLKLRDRLVAACNKALENANTAKTRASGLEAKIDELEEAESDLGNSIVSKNSSIAELDKQIATKTIEAENRNQQISERIEKLASLDNQIDKRTSERTEVNAEVTQAQAKLTELQRDIHLFPSEISGYVKQGSRNSWFYAALCVIPFILMIFVTWKLFSNAEQLLNVFLTKDRPPIVEYLLSRLPYALVSAIVLTVCYSLLHRLFAEIVAINRRKQDLFKVSIIATDVSFASQRDLNLDAETSYNLRTQTKMELLKEHLKQHLSDNYSYGKSNSLIQTFLELARDKLDTQAPETPKTREDE